MRWLGLSAVYTSVGLLCLMSVAVMVSLLLGGLQSLSLEFITAAPRDMGLQGGIFPVLMSTLLSLSICLFLVLPIGTMSAVFLVLYDRQLPRFNRVVCAFLDILSGTPSVVYGMFGLIFFCETLGLGVSILSGSLTLAVMVLPFFVRSLESSLRVFMPSLLCIGQVSGLSLSSCLLRLLAPAAVPAVIMTTVLASGRALAETAALLFTAGYVLRLPESFLDPGRVISVHIFELSLNIPGGDTRAQASAVVLLVSLFVINIVANSIQKRFQGGMHDAQL